MTKNFLFSRNLLSIEKSVKQILFDVFSFQNDFCLFFWHNKKIFNIYNGVTLALNASSIDIIECYVNESALLNASTVDLNAGNISDVLSVFFSGCLIKPWTFKIPEYWMQTNLGKFCFMAILLSFFVNVLNLQLIALLEKPPVNV